MRDLKKHSCQAVLVQYGHDLTSGERLNIGVILVCKRLGFVGAKFARKLRRISCAFPEADVPTLRFVGKEIEAAARAWQANGQLDYTAPLGDAREFYYSVMPKMDSSVALSDPIVGITADPEKTLAALYGQYVARFLDGDTRSMREDADVWRTVATKLEKRNIAANSLTEMRVEGPHYEYTFQHAWKNGRWKAVQPISFDLANPAGIGDKAAKWSGKLRALHLAQQGINIIVLVGRPSDSGKTFREAARNGIALLGEELDGHAQVVGEEQADKVAEQIAQDLGAATS